MLNAIFPRDLRGTVCAAVIDHEDFDRIDPVDVSGKVLKCFRKAFFFVQARDLDDQLHDYPRFICDKTG